MKNKRDFIREYRKINFPFKEIITCNKELRKALFAEFLKTKPKTCSHLHLLDYYTERQINDGIIEAGNKIPTSVSDNRNVTIAGLVKFTPFETHYYQLQGEFNNCIVKNTLPAKYYCFDLEGTNTVKTLSEIGEVIKRFQDLLRTDNVNDYDTEAKHTSKAVVALMDHVEYKDLKDGVFQEIINDNESKSIVVDGIFGSNNQKQLKDNYSRLKMYFDNYLKEGYRPLQVIETETEPEQITKETSKTKQSVSKELENIDKTQGWKYAFTNEEDFNSFLDLITCYFEYKPYSLPHQSIKLKRDCKTRFAKALSPIHKELSEKPLKSDVEFFKLLRVVNHFENLTDIEIYNAITR